MKPQKVVTEILSYFKEKKPTNKNMVSETLDYLKNSANKKIVHETLNYLKSKPTEKIILTKPIIEEIGININSEYYFNNTIISPSALPINLKNFWPLYIFGQGDFVANFNLSQKSLPLFNWIFDETKILSNGNLQIRFKYPVGIDFYRIYIYLNCSSISYIALLNNTLVDHYNIKSLKYISPDVNQYKNPILFIRQSIFGNNRQDTIDPNTFKTSNTFQQLIVDIPVNLILTNNLIICLNVNYSVQNLSLLFSLQEIL